MRHWGTSHSAGVRILAFHVAGYHHAEENGWNGDVHGKFDMKRSRHMKHGWTIRQIFSLEKKKTWDLVAGVVKNISGFEYFILCFWSAEQMTCLGWSRNFTWRNEGSKEYRTFYFTPFNYEYFQHSIVNIKNIHIHHPILLNFNTSIFAIAFHFDNEKT